MIKRQGWAIAWRGQRGQPPRLVAAHGGLMIYTVKREAALDFDPDTQKVVRVLIQEKKK